MSRSRRTMVVTPRAAVISTLALAAMVACKAKPTAKDEPPPTASGVAPGASVVAGASLPEPKPIPPEKVQQEINPGNLPPHTGATGIVRGVVKVTGDPAPDDLARIGKIQDAQCAAAKDTYGKVFRAGPGRTLADVLVAVTGYEKRFVPPVGKGPEVTVRSCAFDTRTVALTYGQVVAVRNRGGEAVIPELVGEKSKALLVAMPGGSPVHVYPTSVGHYALVDASHPFATADVYVLRFSTFDVTGLDGKFEIDRVPVGEVKVSAYLPATGKTVEKKITVTEGQPQEIAFEIPFDAANLTAAGSGPAPAASQ